jgi:hypothetical protein
MPARFPRRLLGCCLISFLALAGSGVLAAQSEGPTNYEDSARGGWQLGLGLGAGRADLTCDGCVFDSRTGVSGFLSVARTVGKNTRLGVEGTVWKKEMSPGNDTWVYSVTPHLTQYLLRGSGLFLRGGLGLVGFHSESQAATDIHGIGVGFSSRIGYELGTGRLRIAPYIGLARSLGGVSARADGDAGVDVTVTSVQFGLSVATP